YHNYPVNQMFGLQSNFPSFMDTFHQVNTVEDADHYISRLEAMELKFEQVMEGLKVREEKGIIPPTFVIDKVLTEMNGFVGQDAKDNILYASFKAKLEAAEDVPEGKHAGLLSSVEARLNDVVYPTYQTYITYFTALRDKSTTDAGVWKLPDGARYYQQDLRGWNTTDLTPDEIHNIGLSEVDRIQAEIVAILGQEGFDTSKGFTALINELAADERFYFADTDEGRQQILDGYDAIISDINKDMPKYFNRLPKAGVEVRRIPAFKEKTAPGGYYNAPAMDGSRPGIFYANLYDIKATPKYGMRTLAYHEAVPGHHFQIAITMELEGLPMFRNLLGFSAYSEGWGLYAEQFAKEVGYLDDPFDRVGQLQSELFRSVRLVVDTGIHAKRWTREEAIDYMADNTGMAMSDVVSEIERYIVLDGQATAYKIGMLEILSLREMAKTQLGAAFDIAEFHDVILKDGAMPLSILRSRMEEYIEAKKAAL
ncbi:MAG: DUF885 domain-containing protein, partial [Sphingomonadales bacterium]|nr:DUF885 domain-containing protein [Sphingomonadales bacterium]